jgi:hypothetical protein
VLRWNHDWGTKAPHFDALLGMGSDVPSGFLERPEILPVAAFYWSAFCALETERPIGMAVGQIPWSRALEYATEHGIVDADEFTDFWQIITRLDNEASRIRRVSSDDDENLRERVSINDPEGVKNLMRNLGKKRPK